MKIKNIEIIENNEKAKPFLRWAGGKRWLVKHINTINKLEINNYYEPFLGGASIFLSLNNYENAILSDLNLELIETYTAVKEKLDKVISCLEKFENTEDEYYRIRNKQYENDFERASKFIYLNKTSFNGIYRVNQKGVFNVPYGFRTTLTDLIDEKNLTLVSKKLKKAEIKCQDFSNIAENIKKGDLVFLDPPYTVAHENNGFIQYNQKIFSLDDQVRLSILIEKIKEVGAYYILTNAKHDAILEIYNKIDKPITLSRNSTVGGIGARRETFNEYVFSNCL